MKKLAFLLTLFVFCLTANSPSSQGLTTAAGQTPAVSPAPPSATPGASIQAPSPVPTPVSIVWLSDTQDMAYAWPGSLLKMGQWINQTKGQHNTVYVVQTGDAVENGYSPAQWQAVDAALDAFSGIPYFAVAGNHEIGIRQRDYTAFLSRPYIKNIPASQKFQDGRAAYVRFSAGGIHFLVAGAGWGAEAEAADWLDQVLRQYPKDTAILLFHSFMDPKGDPTVPGKKLIPWIVEKNPNVCMVLSGHMPGRFTKRLSLDSNSDGTPDHPVIFSMYDYSQAGARNGQMRVLTFDPIQRSITLITYSPITDTFYRDGSGPEKTLFFPRAF